MEVAEAFNTHIVKTLTGQNESSITELAYNLKEAFETVDISKLTAGFKEILQWVPWQIHEPLEHFYHAVIFSVLKSLHFKVESEVSTSDGTLDLLVVLPGGQAFIVEFKYEKFMVGAKKEPYDKALKTKDAEVKKLLTKALKRARKQMEEKGYAEKFKKEYLKTHKVLVGVVGRTEVAVEIYGAYT
jgi:hypothetical protein